jgi:hypothetical protein
MKLVLLSKPLYTKLYKTAIVPAQSNWDESFVIFLISETELNPLSQILQSKGVKKIDLYLWIKWPELWK